MLVRVQVRGLKAGVENAADLRGQFVVDANAAESDGAHELGDGRRKRRLAHQHQMDTDIERRIFPRQAHGIVERARR